ncbi:MAG: ankyrin repeat domain-containing protein, partial [Chlamydiae bacterium]|nr:ankyrin repeat domain-containing protein [Chlamydiota bacterium]
FLLKEGIQIDEKMINGMTALHLAVISATGSKELIEELMKTGKFDPNATDLLGRTPLHFALISENLSNAKALIQKGGDLFSKSSQIITPFAFFKTLIEIRKSQRDPLPLSRFSLFPLCALTAGRICSFLGYRDAANGLGTLATYGLMVRNILFSDSVPERLSGFIGIGSPNFGNVVATGSLWKAFIHQARLAWKNRHLKGYRPLRNVVVSGMNALLSTWHGLDLLDPTLLCPFKTESACLKSLDTKYESHKAWIRDYFKKQYPDATNLDQLYRKASLGRHPDQCELSSKTDCSEIFPKIAAAFGR